MSDDKREDPMDLSRVRIARDLKMTTVEIGALAFAIVWVLVCIVFFFGLGGTEPGTEKNGVGFVMVVASVLVPIAVVWLAVAAARSARIMTDESERLQATMSLMRKTLIEVQEFQALSGPSRDERPPRIPSAATPRLEGSDAAAMFASSRPHDEVTPGTGEMDVAAGAQMRDVSPRAEPQDAPAPRPKTTPATSGRDVDESDAGTQASLELDSPKDSAVAVDVDDLIRAINFPENAEDEEGFGALRRTLVDRRVASLIQAAQDVLTLLSQDGIYMDDLAPQPARAETWRRFAAGARGPEVSALGGISDRSSLALSSGRMKSDPVFRDASLHFLRRFDTVLTAFEPSMDDGQIARFAGTRTARAFMLLGRVTGSFD